MGHTHTSLVYRIIMSKVFVCCVTAICRLDEQVHNHTCNLIHTGMLWWWWCTGTNLIMHTPNLSRFLFDVLGKQFDGRKWSNCAGW